MVSILLLFILAQHKGFRISICTLFAAIFQSFQRCKVGHCLPFRDDLLAEFQRENFVIKRSKRKFNQVDTDHGME